jgi:hypothetical protein
MRTTRGWRSGTAAKPVRRAKAASTNSWVAPLSTRMRAPWRWAPTLMLPCSTSRPGEGLSSMSASVTLRLSQSGAQAGGTQSPGSAEHVCSGPSSCPASGPGVLAAGTQGCGAWASCVVRAPSDADTSCSTGIAGGLQSACPLTSAAGSHFPAAGRAGPGWRGWRGVRGTCPRCAPACGSTRSRCWPAGSCAPLA